MLPRFPLFVVPSVVPSAPPPLPQRGRTIIRRSLKQQTPNSKSRRTRSSSSESSQRECTPPRSRTPSDRSRRETPVSEACRSGTPDTADGRPVLPATTVLISTLEKAAGSKPGAKSK